MVSTTDSRINYTGNGVTVNFSFPYYLKEAADLKVKIFDTVTYDVTDLELDVDFSISGSFTSGFGYLSGVVVNIPGGTLNVPAIVPATNKIAIFRDPVEEQNTNLPANTPYAPVAIHAQLDAIVLMLQRFGDLVSRSQILDDGFVGTFDPQIPAFFPGQPGACLIQRPDGEGWETGPDLSDLAVLLQAAADAVAASATAVAAAAAAAASAVSAASAIPTTNVVDVTAGDSSQSLPPASANPGKYITYVNKSFASANKIVVNRTGGDLIQGAAAADNIFKGESRTYYSDGVSNWFIIG